MTINSFKNVDLNNGEMPIADGVISLADFPILVEHIHRILNTLPRTEISWPIYCFAFWGVTPSNLIEANIFDLEIIYPEARFYECDGRKVFDVRSSSGGITSAKVCYLMAK